METGVINEESLSNILRSISQRKKNGVLEINLAEQQISVLFAKGKVVEIVRAGLTPAEEVVQILKRAGWAPAQAQVPAANYGEAFGALKSMQLPRGPISEDLFRRVVKHRVLDQLYQLDMGAGAYYTFKVQMVESDKDFAPGISSGQILLDLVSLKQDAARFAEAFPAGVSVSCAEDAGGLSEEDEVVWNELAGGSLSVEQLSARAMLSRFHFQDVLLGMIERGAITTSQAGEAAGEEAAVPSPGTPVSTAAAGAKPAAEARPVPRLSPRTGIATFHNRLLQDGRIPHLLILFALAAGVLGPIFLWAGVWGEY